MSYIVQGTGAWLQQRVGKLTASHMSEAMAFLKSGAEAAERRNLRMMLLAERMTGDAAPHYVNEFMRWGIETEPQAKAAYEAETGVILKPCGFYDHPEIANFGATPDALLQDGLCEIKCPQTKTHLEWMIAGVVPEQHKPQMLAQLACTGRKWCEFVSYDPRITIPGRELFIVRYEPAAEEIAKIEAAAQRFLGELDAMFDQLAEAA